MFFLFFFFFFFFFFGVVSTPVGAETTPGPDAMAGRGPSVCSAGSEAGSAGVAEYLFKRV